MPPRLRLPVVPASFFGIVLGLGGMANAWRAAHRVWGFPAAVGETFAWLAVAVWAVVLACFVAKWLFARDAALAEWRHPVQNGFVVLAGVSTMLVSVVVLPYTRLGARMLFAAGLAFAGAFAIWQTGRSWQGGRTAESTTPVLYLPTVGVGLVAAIALSAFGETRWAQLAFGLGVFTWLAIESVLLQRLFTAAPMPPAQRPTLGIELAPPTLGAIAYLAFRDGPPDAFAHALLGYGIVIALVLLRLLPWILEQPFAASYWGFTFGITALAIVPLRMIERGDTGPAATLAPLVFGACNVAMSAIVVATLRLIIAGRLLPPLAAQVAPPPTA